MGFLSLANVALDPLYFGGDGSTREAFEVGLPVVSLPSAALGSRWTAAMYDLLGLDRASMPIVSSPEEYVRTAIDLAQNLEGKRDTVAAILLEASNKYLFHREDAVGAWERVLRDLVER
uniref:O-GlcNAc transferase C-terminal domain-containing protein n=1 Tax=Rhizochromulina marina TaxID=1034831 RepID=A0A7S2R9P7_9STRA|mmetsp:Transcript_13057/g.37959  ORF Transcript_13057/g.37959 Transcript_13057/m.37959 type:complete len:119 (+) Transcript_13057:135-491(+)